MPLNEELLHEHRSFRDPQAGIQEEFLWPRLGPGRTVAALSQPLGPPSSIGWVICHSFGIEQVHLYRLEVLAARRLAAAGFPVLRFHVQGYGDSERRAEAVEVDWHLDGAVDAAALIRETAGVSRVGLLGARFGALVAMLAAGPAGASLLGLWQPFATGGAFLDDFLQTALFEDMLDRGTRDQEERPVREDMARQGWTDLNGFRLTRTAFDQISAIDVKADLPAFDGSALVLGISRSDRMPPEPARVAAHLRSLGATCVETVVRDRSAPIFGQHHFAKVGDGEVERDLLFVGFRSIADETARWAETVDAPTAVAGGGA